MRNSIRGGLEEEMDATEDKEERKEEVEVVPLIIRKKRKRSMNT